MAKATATTNKTNKAKNKASNSPAVPPAPAAPVVPAVGEKAPTVGEKTPGVVKVTTLELPKLIQASVKLDRIEADWTKNTHTRSQAFIDDLAKDIEANGLTTPLVVMGDIESGKLRVIEGYSRFEALMILKAENRLPSPAFVDVMVAPTTTDARQAIFIGVRANVGNRPYTQAELARLVYSLTESSPKMTLSEIGATLGSAMRARGMDKDYTTGVLSMLATTWASLSETSRAKWLENAVRARSLYDRRNDSGKITNADVDDVIAIAKGEKTAESKPVSTYINGKTIEAFAEEQAARFDDSSDAHSLLLAIAKYASTGARDPLVNWIEARYSDDLLPTESD